ncbi:PucR family transcriptional regulator [Neobacillus sp. SM06]|uniref:PucR family transcriptional regulator n=1 Tax=Neobacillus sp. SM06 TaxID=3422492 RepID=UPI003D2A7720
MNSLLDNPFIATFDRLEEFADLISQVLHCPITIEDANHRLLAYSTHDERTDPARISTIISRRVPEKVINQLWKEGIIPALNQSKKPIRIKNMNEIGLGRRVAISIWLQDEVIGYIWALEIDKILTEQELGLLIKAADSVKNKLLQLQTHKKKKEERFQEFFWQLLTGHVKRKEEMIEHFQLLQITPQNYFSILVFHFQQTISSKQEQNLSYFFKTSSRLEILLYTIDHDKLILLVSASSKDKLLAALDQFIKKFKCQMKERFGISKLEPAYSNIYEDYQKIKKAYQEALTVLTIKGKFPFETVSIDSYQKLGIYQYFDLLLEKRKRENYENVSIKMLHEYDKKHQSNLVETLEVFLTNDTNMNDTAKELNVHTNTLIYRLKRISEIAGINLKNPNEKMMLFLDLKLEKYQQN